MANTGVSGRVIYSGTINGIPNLKIQVVDLDGVPDEQSLGWSTTSSSGNYSVTYPASAYGSVEWQPDIVIRVYDLYLRLLYETVEVSDVTAATLPIPDISLHPNNVTGWLVTNATINPSGTPVNISAGNEINFYIDNENAWGEITDAAAATANFINFQLLFWDLPTVITKFASFPVVGTAVTGGQLQVKFKDAVLRGLPVRVIMNDFSPDIFGLLDTAAEVTDFFHGTAVVVRLFPTIPLSPFHAKLMIVDTNTAYLIGSPIMNEYFDSQSHLIWDPRRGPMGITNSIKVPIHEVSTKVMGPAVNAIDSSFCLAWNKLATAPPALSAASGQLPRSGSQIASVQVIRTLPGNLFPSVPHGETGILEGYQRAFANAEDFIYIEDQYFTSYELVDALIESLRYHLNLQIILLLNTKVDIPGYSALQPRVINQFINGVRSISAMDRVGIFTLWSHETNTGAVAPTPTSRIMRNYVHSKTSMVDDKWLTVGSANTDGTSLNQTQVFGSTTTLQAWRPTQQANPNALLQPFRATELNLSIFNNIAGQPATTIITDLRHRLWQEHLGFASPTDPALITKPSGGWLSLWNEKAQYKLDGLLASPISVRAPRILKWTTVLESHKNPNNYLRVLGVDVTKLSVMTEVTGFNFKTGNRQ